MDDAATFTRTIKIWVRSLGRHATAVLLVLSLSTAARATDNEPPPGFTALFNGRDLSGWKVPEGDGGHWKVVDGAIDYDAQSEARGDKSLWLEREFGDTRTSSSRNFPRNEAGGPSCGPDDECEFAQRIVHEAQ
jgi:Domain of Unknown Function (DUF1080)